MRRALASASPAVSPAASRPSRDWLRDAGFEVIDADRLVAELYQPGGEGAAAVRDLFGPGMLDERGAVDHAKVAARVFSDAAARASPWRRRSIPWCANVRGDGGAGARRRRRSRRRCWSRPATGRASTCVVTVEAPCELRLERAVARGMNRSRARARLLAQGDGEQRREAAHRMIDNSGDSSHLRRQVDELIDELKRLARRAVTPFVLVTGNRRQDRRGPAGGGPRPRSRRRRSPRDPVARLPGGAARQGGRGLAAASAGP